MERELERIVEEKTLGEKTLVITEQELYRMIEKKFMDDPKMLRVYLDKENHRYFIDVFAAFSLGFTDYESACYMHDTGKELYEISGSTLRILEDIFKNKIVYERLISKDKKTREKEIIDQNDIHNNEVKKMVLENQSLNTLGDDIRLAYENYKEENPPIPFDKYLAQNGYENNENNDYENNNTNDDTISKFKI